MILKSGSVYSLRLHVKINSIIDIKNGDYKISLQTSYYLKSQIHRYIRSKLTNSNKREENSNKREEKKTNFYISEKMHYV